MFLLSLIRFSVDVPISNIQQWVRYLFITILTFSVMVSCTDVTDTFSSRELISSSGEGIYINTLSWGITDDTQHTIVTKDKTRLMERKDTLGTIKGLSPFIYRFVNDSLTIYSRESNKAKLDEGFESIHVSYRYLKNSDYMDITNKALRGIERLRYLP